MDTPSIYHEAKLVLTLRVGRRVFADGFLCPGPPPPTTSCPNPLPLKAYSYISTSTQIYEPDFEKFPIAKAAVRDGGAVTQVWHTSQLRNGLLLTTMQIVLCPAFFSKALVKQDIDRKWLEEEALAAYRRHGPDHKWDLDSFQVAASLLIGALVRVLGPPCMYGCDAYSAVWDANVDL